ncbi:NAD(P)/FAD-dependent oxidoreductase [Paenibacillus nanensis]|uniref:NAD(P)/FAD-dependent oxidoreductase n=1 Tax=Paenibacillus nanensis TaxID=393251 RepID=A0A3A1VGW9_9BACL|nr:nitrite reductase large subunit NirB [Paenibacillus nanensis]RIX60158.1 NAD(P)/FAD-dependent oxidoreductase [Paenibacillus nanensis]
MKKTKLVVVGNGMAGVRCVEEILKLDPERFHITIIGSEPRPNYNRILLSKVLQGNSSMDEIVLNDWSWYKENGIELLAGESVVRIRKEEKIVETASGIKAGYDVLILATGSSPFMPPIDGIRKPGVIAFRNMDDCRVMMDYAVKYRKAAVIGGGLLGLEAARGLLHLGMETEVIHNAPYLMNRQLDLMSAELLRKELEGQGMRFRLNANTESIVGRSRAKGLRFTSGAVLDADLIIVAVGISPNIELARGCGIATNRAIIVDDYMRTSAPDIYAVGECAEHRGIAYGLVAPLYEQGKVLARALCRPDEENAPYTGSIPSAKLKVSGVEMFSVGDIEAETALQSFDGIKGTYKKVTMRGGRICGAILYGDTAESGALLQMVKRGAPASELASAASTSGGGREQDEIIAAMPDRETVCACNAVTKSMILKAVAEEGLETADQVRDRTKASSSCGGCRATVEAIVGFAKRSGAEGMAEKSVPMCGCTESAHHEVKEAIANSDRGWRSPEEAVQALGWRNLSGCDTCMPAIRYYMSLKIVDAGRSLTGEIGRRSFIGLKINVAEDDGAGSPFGYDALCLGGELRRMGETLTFPYPVRAAAASGIHQAVGVLVHDIGLNGSPAGWEIYAAGHSENPVKQGQLLGLVETSGQALELAGACLQLYRERADFLEPMWKWVEREGIVEIREALFDPEARAALFASFASAGGDAFRLEREGVRL